MELQKYRDSLIDRAAAAFSEDLLDEASFEAFASRVQDARGEAELRAAESLLPSAAPASARSVPVPSGRREIALNMSTLKKRGLWVDAGSYRLEAKMSNFELDFRSYADEERFDLDLDVDLSLSNLKLLVPPDWRVDIDLERNSASNVKDRGPAAPTGACRVRVRGSASMSNIKVRRRSSGGRFFAFLFGGRP